MARSPRGKSGGAKLSAPAQPADAAASATPAPSATLHATLTELPKGQVLHRVHQEQYRADQFNPGVRGNARFSPIQDDQGQPIPTLYGGTTMDCALMETVFHDVPHTAGFKTFDKSKLSGQVHSTVEVVQPVKVVDLASVPLRKLGITRKQLVDTEKDQYPATRKWAEALHRQYVCDKRYLLLLMFLDYAVEPFYYERGQDFYTDGQNYALASLLYTAGPTLFGKRAFDHLLASFQRAVKEKSPRALGDLVQAARNANWRTLPEALGPLAQFAAPECLKAIATPGVSTDAALVVLQSLISRMEVMADSAYRVEHDQSKNLLTYHDLLQSYIDHDEAITFRQTEIAIFTFPLKLHSVTQVDSKSSPAVQLADVMIGAAIEVTNTLTGQRAGGLDALAVMALYADHQLIHMLPSINFDQQKRFRQGTQASEVIDYFASHFPNTAAAGRGV